MAQDVWVALSEIQDHFAMLGGAARYPGFEDGDPPLFVGLLLQLGLSIPKTLTGFRSEQGLDKDRFRVLMDEMAGGSQELADCLNTLQPWNPDRFPDVMVGRVISRLFTGASIHSLSSAEMIEYVEKISRQLPKGGSRRWDRFSGYVMGSERSV